MRPKYAKQINAQMDKLFHAGFDTGEQFSADCFARAMYRAGVSKRKIIEITGFALEDATAFSGMFDIKQNPEADVLQEHFDSGLHTIFGELFKPFRQRYDWIREIRY